MRFFQEDATRSKKHRYERSKGAIYLEDAILSDLIRPMGDVFVRLVSSLAPGVQVHRFVSAMRQQVCPVEGIFEECCLWGRVGFQLAQLV